MFTDGRKVPAGTRLEADLCIIGGGAAGITLARQFAHSTLRVALLESGGFDLDLPTESLNQGVNTGLPYFSLETTRLRYFGGTTNHWAGLCRPFDDFDFERHDWIPHSGWPIGKNDLDPFYGRARVLCGLPTDRWDTDYWLERDSSAPLPLANNRIESRVAQQVLKAVRSFGQVYRDEIGKADNVVTYLHSNVTNLEATENGSAIKSVQVATLAGNHFDVAARIFVLAVGGIENPRVLLASNQQRPRGLGNDHDLVGRFFLEHPRFTGGVIFPTKRDTPYRFYQSHRVGAGAILGYLAVTSEAKRRERIVDTQIRIEPVYVGSFATAKDSEAVVAARSLYHHLRKGQIGVGLGNDILHVAEDLMSWQEAFIEGAPLPVPYPQLISKLLDGSSAEVKSLIPEVLGNIPAYAYTQLSGHVPLQMLALSTRITPVPNPQSRVTLARERDRLGMPRAQLHWALSSLDRDSVTRTLEILGAAVGRAGIGRLKILLDGSDGHWPEDLKGGNHEIGTTRMSNDPKAGVVDQNCQVHGIANLFVAGSSVFPTAGSGTPTMTLTALTLRLAEHLKGVFA